MANKKAPIDFTALLEEVNSDFPVYQALRPRWQSSK